jgi:hypothetical protein
MGTPCPKWSSSAFGIRFTTNLSNHHIVKPAGHRIIRLIQHRGDLEEVSNMRSVPNWISYLHANSWILVHF